MLSAEWVSTITLWPAFPPFRFGWQALLGQSVKLPVFDARITEPGGSRRTRLNVSSARQSYFTGTCDIQRLVMAETPFAKEFI